MGISTIDLLSLLSNAIEARDYIKLQSLILPLKSYILELEKENAKLNLENFEYAKKIKEYEDWEKSKNLYKPYKTSGGVIVYVFREEKEFKEFFCPNCYAHKIIVHLQPYTYRADIKFCPTCKNQLYFHD